MIPEKIVAILSQLLMYRTGTRNAALRPTAHTMSVAYLRDPDHLTVLVPAFSMHDLRENLADNGWLALTVAAMSHESYQLKGHVSEVRAAKDAELERVRTYFSTLRAALGSMGVPEQVAALLDGVQIGEVTAVTFLVEEAYDQTPGSAAGERLL